MRMGYSRFFTFLFLTHHLTFRILFDCFSLSKISIYYRLTKRSAPACVAERVATFERKEPEQQLRQNFFTGLYYSSHFCSYCRGFRGIIDFVAQLQSTIYSLLFQLCSHYYVYERFIYPLSMARVNAFYPYLFIIHSLYLLKLCCLPTQSVGC